MQGNFCYFNPTKLYFGDKSLDFLHQELKQFGRTVLLVYGGGSIKQNGIYDQVVNILKTAGKDIVEDAGVMANPTVEKLYEGARLARENAVDLILAVGGGSVCDYAKGVAVAAHCADDAWDKFYVRQEDPSAGHRIIPVGCVLTMVGTGSEMNGGSVITHSEQKLKIGKVFDARVMPKFSVLNPIFTYTVPQYQMVAGFYDIMSHILEQYFSGEDDNTSDYLAEGLMRSLVHSSLIAVRKPHDYEARSNIMWTATWALNTMIKMGKSQDWMVHMIGQSIGAYTNATHGMTLSAVSLAYYRHVMVGGLHKFARFAETVWGISPVGKTQRQLAEEGLLALEKWMKEIGLVLSVRQLGVTEDMFDGIARGTFILEGGYKVLTQAEVIDILRESM